MFNLFRRRGRSSKQEKQTKNVAKLDDIAAKSNGNEAVLKSPQQTDVTSAKRSARASESKVNLDSSFRPKEKPQISIVNYHQCGGDGVVVSETSSGSSRNKGADLLVPPNANATDSDSHGKDLQKSEVPAKKQPKSKSLKSNRSSIFFRHFRTTTGPIEDSYRQLNEDQVNAIDARVPPTPSVPLQPIQPIPTETNNKPSKRFNPIEKGREIFNDILMAKGRHRNHRNHHHKGGGAGGGGQASKAHQSQDSKRSPADASKKNIPEASIEQLQQHSYQITEKSKNTQDRQSPDGAIAAAIATIVPIVSATDSVECADSSDKNNSSTAQPFNEHHPEKRSFQTIAGGKSSCDHQTVNECASIQTHREIASSENTIGIEVVAPAKQGKDLEIDCVTSFANVEQFGRLNTDNFSELTECDRDRFIVDHSEDMGQTQAKSEQSTSSPVPESRRSLSPSAREFRESHTEQQKTTPKPTAPQLIVPTIIVEDFGNACESPSEKSDIFYDVESHRNIDVDDDKIDDHLLKVPEEAEDDDEEDDDANEDEEDQWHFVNNLQQSDNQAANEEIPQNYEKAENSSDSNLSTSDSGIGTTDPIAAKVLHLDSCDLVNDSDREPSPRRFRDGSSTDCDENLPQCEDFDYFKHLSTVVDSVDVVEIEEHDNHSGILIETISLPDVVVESTAAESSNSFSKNPSSDSVNSGDQQEVNSSSYDSDNVDNSASVRMGNTHFIPIRVEKRRSVDDSILMTKSAKFGNSLYNGQQYNDKKPTLEITTEEDEEEVEQAEQQNEQHCPAAAEDKEQKRDLVDQESRFNSQLDDAQKNVYNLQTKVNELQSRIDDLEKDLSVKSWHIDRLQGELGAAHKEDECVRMRLRLLEDEKTILRQKYFETEEELTNKYDDLERQYNELEEKYKHMQSLAGNLQTQLACAQSEADQCREETEKLREEKDEQVRNLEEALEAAKAEKEASQIKWQKEFETLRTQNADREEHLMNDCEWQLRQMQKSCKDKIDKAEHLRKEAVEKGLKIEQDTEEKLKELVHLESYAAEVKQLRGLTSDQENSLDSMRNQIESLKADLVIANENLEEQIECVRKIRYQCDNAIYDKERQMLQRIDEVRNEAASLWENKLITEMTRLKMELESVYVEDRREELDKLQAEHLEELKALTTRYTANEEELRAEIAELREALNRRNQEFMEMREKSDNAILQTRMHLDRADRDYQTAMCREEEKRESLVANLRKEFEEEKLEMEEKFRERLGQVQAEFNKELQISTQEFAEQHRKEMEQQWQKMVSDKEEAMQELEVRHRKRLQEAEKRLRDTETRHQHDLADLKIMYDTEKTSLDKRDMSNAQEIEQLHRKCRCLTNLFEEMRMRYERRDPRQEDLREIAELRSRCEAQERDLYELTDRLREMQIQMEELQNSGSGSKKKSQVRKPPPKTIPTNCDVIYEENEERDSPPRPLASPIHTHEEEADDEDDSDEEEEEEEENSESTPYQENTINDDDRDHPNAIVKNEKTKSLKLINETIIENHNQIIEAEEC